MTGLVFTMKVVRCFSCGFQVPGKMTFGSKLAPVPADFSIGKVSFLLIHLIELHLNL